MSAVFCNVCSCLDEGVQCVKCLSKNACRISGDGSGSDLKPYWLRCD
jgi:hypothetical protein